MKSMINKIKDRLLRITLVRLIYDTIEGAVKHDAAQRAAGVAYYSLLSIFPLMLGLIAVFGFFLPSVDFQNELLKFVDNNVPGATDFLRQNITHIISLRSGMGILSIVILFWSASAMFGAINLAINRAWEVRRYRLPFPVRKSIEIGMVFGIGIIFLLSLGAGHLISILHGVSDLAVADMIIVKVGSRLVAFLLIFIVFLLLYKLIPNTKTHWRYTWPGALLAAVFFEIARTLFILYLENLVSFQYIYGSIASIIILLVWIYYSAFIMILGAEFTFQYGRLREPVAVRKGDR
jgi:membrane protein